MHSIKVFLLLLSAGAFSLLVSCRTAAVSSSLHTEEQGHGGLPAWSYTGDQSPDHWSDLCSEFKKCAEGQHQSPIDIETVSLREISGSGLKLQYHPSQVDVQNNGHTIEVDLEEPDTLDTGNGTFVLKQFHFHEPAEHKIDGVLYPMEMHLVHVNPQGQLAVLGVFIKEGTPNAALAEIWEYLPAQPEKHVHARQPLDLMQILPAERSFYHYEGSLTTPPCTEGVNWYVLKSPLTLSKEQVETFKHLYHGNSRPVQDKHNRPVNAAQK